MLKRKSAAPAMEQLEQRELLSTVVVTYSGYNITVTGDAGGSSFSIVGQPGTTPPLIVVHDGADIITHGTPVFDSARTNLTVRLGAGNDTIAVGPISLKSLKIVTGNGINNVAIGGSVVQTSGAMTITGGTGDDTIYLDGGTYGKTSIKTGAGNDRIFIGGGDVNPTPTFASTFTLDMGAGDDRLELSDSPTQIATSNFVGQSNIKMGLGNDTVIFGGGHVSSTAVFHGLSLDFGAGDDFFSVDVANKGVTTTLNGKTKFLFGDGNDKTAGIQPGGLVFPSGSDVTFTGAGTGFKSAGLRLGLLQSAFFFDVDLLIRW